MSGKKDTDDAPFGYMFDFPETGPSAIAHPPPSERPLLHEHESGFLDSFFSDPSNIDPTALSSMPTDFQGEGNNAFGSNTFDWFPQSTGDFDQNPTSLTPHPNQAGVQSEWQGSGLALPSGVDTSREMQPSADVYQAAGILHNNNNNNIGRQHGANAYNEIPFAQTSVGINSNGYTYPPINTTTAANYNYNSPTTGQVPYSNTNSEFSPRYAQAENSSPYGTGFDGNGSANGRRNTSLAFGSDDNFRHNTYPSTGIDGPEKDLAEAIAYNFANQDRIPSAPMANMRKRTRQGNEDERSGNDGSYDEEDGESRKRRKGPVKDEDEEDYQDGSYGRGKKGKRRSRPAQPTPAAPARTPIEPQQATKPRPPGSRPPRENLTEEQKRENHINSEQKRRDMIKTGFDDMVRMVPELRQGSLSKSNMLAEGAKFIRRVSEGNNELEALVGPLDKG